MESPHGRASGNRSLLMLLGLLGVVFIIGLGAILLLVARKQAMSGMTRAPASAMTSTGNASTAFAQLSEEELPGRYKWSDGDKVTYITLNDDHTFVNKDGTVYLTYQWELLPDRLRIHWQSSMSEFTEVEGPGIFRRMRSDGVLTRLQKLPPLSLAKMSAAATDTVASIVFAQDGRTNGFSLANTGGDGSVISWEVGGKECQLAGTGRGKKSAYVYFRIADELKTMSNAVVTVEYFDEPAIDPLNGWITIQYDAVEGPYTRAANEARLRGSGVWTQAVFYLESPVFQSRQNDRADFRICVANPELPVRSVKLARNVTAR